MHKLPDWLIVTLLYLLWVYYMALYLLPNTVNDVVLSVSPRLHTTQYFACVHTLQRNVLSDHIFKHLVQIATNSCKRPHKQRLCF